MKINIYIPPNINGTSMSNSTDINLNTNNNINVVAITVFSFITCAFCVCIAITVIYFIRRNHPSGIMLFSRNSTQQNIGVRTLGNRQANTTFAIASTIDLPLEDIQEQRVIQNDINMYTFYPARPSTEDQTMNNNNNASPMSTNNDPSLPSYHSIESNSRSTDDPPSPPAYNLILAPINFR